MNKVKDMDNTYYLVAEAVHVEQSLFGELIVIKYAGKNIELSKSVNELVKIFKNENFTIDDLKIILQYAIMSKDKDSEKFRLAINDLTLRENKNNFSKCKREYSELKYKYAMLESKCDKLEMQNETLVQTIANISKIICVKHGVGRNQEIIEVI
jgi:hypothetical protein